MAQQVLPAAGSNDAMAPHVRLFTAGMPSSEAPKWYYQDLQGQLQGPFDASTMSRWCGENALPLDLKCLGVHSQDSNIAPSSAAISHFQPLQKLLDNTAAGIQYMPVRLGKGSFSDEGPATPQSAAPPKGSRTAGPGGPTNHAQAPAGATTLSNGGPDVTRAGDQRASLAAAAAAVAAASGGLNGLPLGPQQNSALLQHLQMATQQQQLLQLQQQQQQQVPRPGSQQRQQQTMPNRRANQQPGGTANHFAHEQQQQQGTGGFMPPAAAVKPDPEGSGGADEPSDLTPGSEAWEPTLLKLVKREGFAGKEADVKWRVILVTGDRVGPFSTEQMIDWLLGGKPPKGINKQQAQQTAQNLPALQVAGILSSDYNAQRLPGAKFFKPLGSLLALVAAGMQYQAVNKHDLQRGLPNKGWNDGPAAGGSSRPAAAGPTPPLPSGKGGKAGKGAAARGNAGAAGAGNNKGQLPGSRSSSTSQLPGGNRSRSSTPGGLQEGSDGPAVASSAKSSTFKHPMALRQQQRQQQQQEALLAAAGQALPGQQGQPGAPNAAGVQPGKGLAGAGARMGPLPPPGSASRSILTAANNLGAAGMPGSLQQQQQQFAGAAALAAQQAAAGRLAQGLSGPQQQFMTPQQQMQAASMAFLQTQQGTPQAVWLKQQQQLPGQTLVGFPGMPGYPMAAGGSAGPQQMTPADAASATAMGHMLQNAGLPRTSSTGSSAHQQQQPPPSVSGVHSAQLMQQQQLVPAGDAQAWQLQQQAAAAGKVRPPAGVPAFAVGQHGLSHSPQLVHAAALLFLHDQQQQQQPPKPDKPTARWWVQRNERAFSGPFTGMQMYQAYLQPGGALRLSDSTPIAAVASTATAPVSGRDVPPTRAFAPLSCLLEAAAHGFVLLPWPVAAAGGGRDNGPSTLLVQQAATGATVPLQSVVSQAGMLALQQQQQQAAAGGAAGEHQQQLEGSSSDPEAAARLSQTGGAQQQQMMAAAKQRQQQPQAQMLSVVRPAGAGGFIQLPNGSIVPAAGLVPIQGGGLAMLQAAPAAAPQPPVVDPLAVASALFTAGNNPNTIVWYIRTDGAASAEGPQSSSIQGPIDPQDMMGMYREGRLGPATMLCATHRAGPGQQQLPPPPETFKPLHALMHTVSTPAPDMHGQQGGAAPGSAAAGAPGGMIQQQMVPAGMILAQAPGSMGPVLFQVPVSSAGPASAVLAMPSGLQLQQMAQMQVMPQLAAGAHGPAAAAFMQAPQGMVAQQHMMAALAAQQRQQAAAAQQHAQQQQAAPGGTHAGPVGQAGAAAAIAGGGVVDNGPNSTGACSSGSPQQLVAAGSSGSNAAAALRGSQQAGAGGAVGVEAVQRAGAVPPRVDTWGSLAAAQELLQRRPSASSSNGQQTPAAAAANSQVEAALAAAANSRRASIEGYHPQGPSSGMMLSGGQHMHQLQQQQHHGHGPKGPQHPQQGFGLSGPRSSSSSSARGHAQHFAQDSAAAAAAAASALAGSLNLQGVGSPSFSQMQTQQQLYMQAAMMAGMGPQSAMQGMALQPQQLHMQQQQAAALAAVSAAAAAPSSQGAPPPPPPPASMGSAGGAAAHAAPEAPAAAAEPASDA